MAITDPSDPVWFSSYVTRCRQRQSLPSVQDWVSAHIQLAPPASAASARSDTTSVGRAVASSRALQYSARNDVRTSAGASGFGIDLGFPPGSSSVNDYNIFANIALHDQAAATIVSASQKKSGFNASMPNGQGIALSNFIVYLFDFIAPHWTPTLFDQEVLTHRQSNHNQFVADVLKVVEKGMRTVGAGNEDVRRAQETVRSLAQRLASNTSQQEQLTLFSNFWMQRPNATDPVLYGIFYLTLEGRYVKDGKTQVLSFTTTAYTIMYRLNSGVLIANEKHYNALYKSSVEDWINDHTI